MKTKKKEGSSNERSVNRTLRAAASENRTSPIKGGNKGRIEVENGE